MNEQNVVYTYNGVLFNIKKEVWDDGKSSGNVVVAQQYGCT